MTINRSDLTFINADQAKVIQDGVCAAQDLGFNCRLQVDGKFFARGQRRVRIQGVTYGPFALNSNDEPFPGRNIVAEDFALMRTADINSIRTYHEPPEWLLRQADEQGIGVFVDVPWRKHLCFLESEEAQKEARVFVRQMAQRCRNHSSILAYSIGNEIPPNIVRWHGAAQVQRFLAELMDVC